jgi:hypothetical protein
MPSGNPVSYRELGISWLHPMRLSHRHFPENFVPKFKKASLKFRRKETTCFVPFKYSLPGYDFTTVSKILAVCLKTNVLIF